MTLFKDYTLTWWQFGLLKSSLMAFGILVGSTWPAVFSGSLAIALLWIVFAVPAIYLVIITLKQAGK